MIGNAGPKRTRRAYEAEQEQCPLPKTILAFLETSAAHALIPVVRELRRRRITIPLYLEGDHDPKSELGKLYPELNDACIVRSADDLPLLGNQKVVLIALSAESKLSKTLLRQCKSCGASVIAVQPDLDDSCMSMLRGPEGETLYPELLVLPHAYNVGQILRATNIPSEDVVVAWPAMDRLTRLGVTQESCAADLRVQLEIHTEAPLVLVTVNTGSTKDPLLGTVAALMDTKAELLVRTDSGETNAPEQLQVARLLTEQLGGRVHWLTSQDTPNPDHLVRGVNLVIGEASRLLVEAIHGEIPAIVIGGDEMSALGRLHAAPHARTSLELTTQIGEVLTAPKARVATWRRYLSPNGTGARQVADRIMYHFLEA